MSIPDAPWIREVEATGYSTYGYWNQPPKDDEDEEEEDDEEEIEMMTAEELEQAAFDVGDLLEENGAAREAEIVRQLIVRYRAARITANNYKKALEAVEHGQVH